MQAFLFAAAAVVGCYDVGQGAERLGRGRRLGQRARAPAFQHVGFLLQYLAGLVEVGTHGNGLEVAAALGAEIHDDVDAGWVEIAPDGQRDVK